MTTWRRIFAVAVVCCVLFAVAEGQEAVYEGRTISQWIEALDGDDLQSRVSAAWVIAEIGPPAAEAVPSLLRAIEDEDEALRMMAAQALGGIGQATEAVIAALQQAVNDADADVRETAVWALEQLGAAEAPLPPGERPPVPPADVTPLVGGTTRPVPTRPGGTAEAYQPLWSEEEAGMAVQSAVFQSYSLGLLDAQGNQLNPHVPRDAVSLTPDDLRAHTRLVAGGSFRTIADVIDFLASFDVRLSATGRTIAVDDVLPDLQRYVTWSFAHRDDPRSGLGVLLGSGPVLDTPEGAPEMAGTTPISSVASLMMLADMLSGVADHDGDGAWGQLWRRPSARGTLLAALGDDMPHMLAAGDDHAASVLTKISGFITQIELDPNFVNMLIGREAIQWERRLLALFDCQNRLTLRLTETVGQASFPLTAVRAEWREDAWWLKGAGDYRKGSSIPLTARVGFMSADGAWVEMPFPRLHYTARLWAKTGSDMLYWLEGAFTMMGSGYSEGFSGKVDIGILIVGAMEAYTGDVSGQGPLVYGADARLGEGGTTLPGGYRIEREGRALNFNLAVSTVPGQPVPTQSPFGLAYLGVTAKLSARDFFEFWLTLVEPMRVMGLTPLEDEALVELATDKLLEVPRICCPIVFESRAKEEPASVRTVELLGEFRSSPGGTVLWLIATHLKVTPDGAVSGLCSLADSRETAQWMWLENLGTFSGRMTEKNPRYEAQRRSNEGRDNLGRLEIGKFEATGTWRGVKLPPGQGATTQRATGNVRVRGTLMEDRDGRYVAEGEMQFHDGGEWLKWGATESAWQEGLKQAQEFEREYGWKLDFPPWEHPDWLEEE